MTKQEKKFRIIKIEERGDYHARTTIPTVRLKGKWLQAAGFNPGASLELTVVSSGVIELRVCSPVQLSAESFRVMGQLEAASRNYDRTRKAA